MSEEAGALALINQLEDAGALSAIGLHLTDPDLPYAHFETLCVFLGKVHEAVRFAIGDAILLAERLYGEQGYQAVELIGLSENARLEYVRVAQRVPRSTRRKDLSWSHHRAVAALPPREQKTWLREASEARLSHAELRDRLRKGQTGERLRTCRCCGQELKGENDG